MAGAGRPSCVVPAHLPRTAPAARALLFGHLLLSPLLFARITSEAFEYPKTSLLAAVAIVLAAAGLIGALGRSPAAGERPRHPRRSEGGRDWLGLGVTA